MDKFYILFAAWAVSVFALLLSYGWMADCFRDMEEVLIPDREAWTGGWCQPKRTFKPHFTIVVIVAVETIFLVLMPMLAYSFPGDIGKSEVFISVFYSVGVLFWMLAFPAKRRLSKSTSKEPFQNDSKRAMAEATMACAVLGYGLVVIWFVFSSISIR